MRQFGRSIERQIETDLCVTLTAVDRNSNIIGTIIHPGLKIALDVLTDSAALLMMFRW